MTSPGSLPKCHAVISIKSAKLAIDGLWIADEFNLSAESMVVSEFKVIRGSRVEDRE